MAPSGKRSTSRRLFSSRAPSTMSPWIANSTPATLYNLLAAFIGGQILLTVVFLTRSAPPCDCRCQWRSEEYLARSNGKAGRIPDHSLKDTPVVGMEPPNVRWQRSVLDSEESHHEIHKNMEPEFNKGDPNPKAIPKETRINPGTETHVNDSVKMGAVFSAIERVDSDEEIKEGDVSGDPHVVAAMEPFTILTTTNAAFSDLTENWLESLRRLGLQYNITVIAEDEGALQYFMTRKARLEASGLRLNVRLTDRNTSHSSALGFHTREYIEFVGRRPHYISDILRSGVAVLFADADAVWLRDPIPLIAGTLRMYDVWVAQGEGGNIPCPCFMYIKPASRAVAMVRAWQRRIEDQLGTSKPENDQVALSSVIKNFVKYKRLRVRTLDITAFPTGQSMFLTKGWYGTHMDEIYVVHANKVGGYAKKKFVLKWKKLWYIGKNSNKTVG